MRKVLLVASFCLYASLANAQTGALTNIRIDFFAVGVDPAVGKPIQTTTIPVAAWLCNQPLFPAPPPSVTNPTTIIWEDPAIVPPAAARLCIVNNNAILIGLPISAIQYFATGVYTNDFVLSGSRSAASNPFSRAVVATPPVVPTGLQVR
jgi:hypothetical protein